MVVRWPNDRELDPRSRVPWQSLVSAISAAVLRVLCGLRLFLHFLRYPLTLTGRVKRPGSRHVVFANQRLTTTTVSTTALSFVHFAINLFTCLGLRRTRGRSLDASHPGSRSCCCPAFGERPLCHT